MLIDVSFIESFYHVIKNPARNLERREETLENSDIIAKNLLSSRTCYNCKHYEWEQGDVEYCSLNYLYNVEESKYEGCQPLPIEKTCKDWKSLD